MVQKMERTLPEIPDIQSAYCLLSLGDSITTDHISPAGNIAKDSPAAKYLMGRGVLRKDFNTYGSRRGNDEVCRASFREAQCSSDNLEFSVREKLVILENI